MGLLVKLKQLIMKSDFFYSSEMLRYQKESDYRTLTGGLLSLGIIATILTGFASMIMDTLNLTSISTSIDVMKNTDPTRTKLTAAPDSNFMFAIEVWKYNLSSPYRFFDTNAYLITEQTGKPTYNDFSMVQCTREHWSSLPQVILGFDKLNISNWLCPSLGSNFDIYGKYSSEHYQQVAFYVSPCKNSSAFDRPCAPQSQIDSLFDQFDNNLYFTLYFINPVINPDEPQYKKYYLEDKSYLIFGNQSGGQAYLYLTDYTINTDYSIWPYSDIRTDAGFLAQDLAVNHPYQVGSKSSYVSFYIAKSSDSIVYTRQVQKISSVFSFMGGLIGAVSAVLFIIHSYTGFSFQVSIALEIFKPGDGEEERQKKESLSMNFINFVRFYLYGLLRKLGRKINWPTMEYLEECHNEILHQLDIKALIKRVVFLQYSLTYLFEDYQLEGLQLKKPTSPHEIKAIREKCEMVESADLSLQDEVSSESANSQDPASNNSFVQPRISHSIKSFRKIVQPQQIQSDYDNNSKQCNRVKIGQAFKRRNGMIHNMNASLSPDVIRQNTIEEVSSESSRQSKMEDVKGKYELAAKRRTNHMISLKQSAMQGNQMSKKILSKLMRRQKLQIQELASEFINEDVESLE